MSRYISYSVLRNGFALNSKLQVTYDKKLLSKELVKKNICGKIVKFKKTLGSQASVEYMGKLLYVPIVALLGYKEYTVLSEPTLLDNTFVVVSKHPDFLIGTVFTASLLKTNHLGFYIGDTYISIDESIKALSVPIKNVQANEALSLLGEKFAVKPQQTKVVKQPVEDLSNIVKTNTTATAVQVLEKNKYAVGNLTDLTHYVSINPNQFSSINPMVEEEVKNISGKFIDMKGREHTSLMLCLEANQIYIDLLYLNLIKDICDKAIKAKT